MNDLWQLFLTLIGVVAAWSVIIITALRVMFSRWERRFDDKIGRFDEKIEGLSKMPADLRELEKDFLKLKADLPVYYVRREDYIRFDTVTNVKLDRLHDMIGKIWKDKNHEN
jgi:hypothetical protein